MGGKECVEMNAQSETVQKSFLENLGLGCLAKVH